MFLRMLELDCQPVGIISTALYRCGKCGAEFTCNDPDSWTSQYNKDRCQKCFDPSVDVPAVFLVKA